MKIQVFCQQKVSGALGTTCALRFYNHIFNQQSLTSDTLFRSRAWISTSSLGSAARLKTTVPVLALLLLLMLPVELRLVLLLLLERLLREFDAFLRILLLLLLILISLSEVDCEVFSCSCRTDAIRRSIRLLIFTKRWWKYERIIRMLTRFRQLLYHQPNLCFCDMKKQRRILGFELFDQYFTLLFRNQVKLENDLSNKQQKESMAMMSQIPSHWLYS